MTEENTQGKFCKGEAESCDKALNEIMDAMPPKKRMEYLGHFNDLFLFLAAAKRAAPDSPA
jgi:hypothetical protein